MDKGWYPAVIL